MKTRKNTEITIETYEKRIIRVNRRQAHMAFCGLCGAKVIYFSVSRAAAVLGLPETAIFRLAENGQMHSLENAAGSLMICGDSLLAVENEIGGRREKTGLIKKPETNREK